VTSRSCRCSRVPNRIVIAKCRDTMYQAVRLSGTASPAVSSVFQGRRPGTRTSVPQTFRRCLIACQDTAGDPGWFGSATEHGRASFLAMVVAASVLFACSRARSEFQPCGTNRNPPPRKRISSFTMTTCPPRPAASGGNVMPFCRLGRGQDSRRFPNTYRVTGAVVFHLVARCRTRHFGVRRFFLLGHGSDGLGDVLLFPGSRRCCR
jgi:hypothetical protein